MLMIQANEYKLANTYSEACNNVSLLLSDTLLRQWNTI